VLTQASKTAAQLASAGSSPHAPGGLVTGGNPPVAATIVAVNNKEEEANPTIRNEKTMINARRLRGLREQKKKRGREGGWYLYVIAWEAPSRNC
jgi:hypothetical protein